MNDCKHGHLGTCCGKAMDKCCETCKWWGVDRWPEDEGARLPDCGEGFAVCGEAKFVWFTTTEWPDEAMSVIDHDGSSADLITRKDHYCSAWEGKRPIISRPQGLMEKLSASAEEFCVGKIAKENQNG